MIKILDTHTINKIAAGEVVERPASVVKELVENSIDAQASSVTVEIKGGGVDLIRVTDNGVGIPKDQVEIAFLRHATSKISAAEDLYEVVSLGFRGEALASIAAVAHVELLTKEEQELTGKRVEVSGGKITTSEEVACPNGTTFIIRQLFYNVPARKAFLRSSATEGAKITDYLYKLALAHPEIAFKYIQNGKTIFSTSGDHKLSHAVLNIYGKEYAKNVISCYYKSDEIECTGLLGRPSLNRGNRNYEHFFINGRYIKSSLLQDAVETAYKTLVMVGKFPFVVLHISINPALVDVNVHPTKLQVRFKNADQLYKAVVDCITEALQKENLVPRVQMDKPRGEVMPQPVIEQVGVDTFFAPRKHENAPTVASLLGGESQKDRPIVMPHPEAHEKAQIKTYLKDLGVSRLFGSETQTKSLAETKEISRDISHAEAVPVIPDMGIADKTLENTYGTAENMQAAKPFSITDNPSVQISQPFKSDAVYSKASSSEEKGYASNDKTYHADSALQSEAPVVQAETEPSSGIDPSEYRIVGQLFKTYWLIQYHEKVFIIDQHAAHERVLYERFMGRFKRGEVPIQMLLLPETLHLTPMENTLVTEHEELFKRLGFDFEPFGEQDIVIRAVPFILNEPLSPEVFREVLDSLSHEKIEDITDLKAESIIRMSCRSAIKAHDVISEEECHELIALLLALDNPFTCPHGRPTLVALTQNDIEKMFKRI